jgi:ATP-dependent helicase HrpA
VYTSQDNIFLTREGKLPDRTQFESLVAEIRDQGLFRLGRQHLTRIMALLAARRAVQVRLNQFRQRTTAGKCFDRQLFDELQSQLDQLVPADFFAVLDLTECNNLLRYLKALGLRIERAEHAPHKDRTKAARLTPFLAHLERIHTFSHPSPPCSQAIALYEKMVQEFRVSIFAPELGTSLPVSAKRLNSQWAIVENSCRAME